MIDPIDTDGGNLISHSIASGTPVPDLTTGSWYRGFTATRPVPGYIEIISRNAWCVARYQVDGNGGQHTQLAMAGPSSSALIAVQAGSVAVDIKANAETTIDFDPDLGFNTSADPAGAGRQKVTIRWHRIAPEYPALAINTAPGVAWLLGPPSLTVGGSTTAYLRPPRSLRRLLLTVSGPVLVYRSVGEEGGLTLAEDPISRQLDTIVSPWETIKIVNPAVAAGAVEFSASWLPLGRS